MTNDNAQGHSQRHHNTRQGHCSRCGRVWTLAEAQGVCQWCGKQASCHQSKGSSRTIKSRRRKRPERPVIGNGYDQLPEPHLTYYHIGLRLAVKVLTDDQADLLHDIIIHLYKAGERKREAGLPFTTAAMYRTAEHVKDHYWYAIRKRTSGLDCGHCSKAQRQKCKKDWLYGECPKAIKLESLNKPVIDSEGNMTELGDLIADDKALDLDGWMDVKKLLLGLSPRMKAIALKKRDGIPLSNADLLYISKWRKLQQKKLL